MQYDMTPINQQVLETWGLVTDYTAAKAMGGCGCAGGCAGGYFQQTTAGRLPVTSPSAQAERLVVDGSLPTYGKRGLQPRRMGTTGLKLPMLPRRLLRTVSPALALMGQTDADADADAEALQRRSRLMGAGMVFAVGMLALSGVGGYLAGKAMAPSKTKEASYAWLGVPVAILGGPLGLGIMGYVATRK